MSADRYDFVITYDSTDYQYMLRQRGDTKDWLINDAPLTPQTLITESASPTNLQPERQIQISQVDWRKGFQDFKLDDEHKYYDSENCDARFKGEVTLSPKKLSAISFGTAPTAVSITDAGIESWAGDTLNEWTETGDGVVDESTTPIHGGSHSAQCNQSDTGSIYQDLSTYSSLYKGHTYTFSVYLYSVNGPVVRRLFVTDGDTTTKSSLTVDDAWTKVSVTHTVSNSADKLRIGVEYQTGAGEGVWIDDFACDFEPSWSGGVVKLVEFGDDIVGALGTSLFTVGASSITFKRDFPIAPTDLCVYQNRLYIAQGWSSAYYYTSDLSTFTVSTLTANTAKYMSNVGNAQFWISDTNSTMTDSDDPINGGTEFASPSYQIDTDDFDITGLVDHEDTVFCRKEDSVYYLSGSDVLELIPEISSEVSTTYTYGLYYWKGNLYIGSGVNSFYEYDISSGVVTVISPVRYAVGDANYDEELLAVCGDETYLYVAFDNGSDLKILAGRWETVDGDTDFYWHPLYDITSNDITAMLISSLSGSKRLYTGTDTYTDGVIPYFIPVGYSQPYTESGYECQTPGTFYTPWYVSNFPTESKYWKSVDFTSICCTDKTSITPSYQIKGGSWTALTALTTSAYSGGYPAETTDSRDIEQSSERIRFKFAMAAAVDEYTPILYGTGGGIIAYATLEADKKRQITATIEVAKKIRLRDLTTEDRVIADDLSDLRTIYKAGGEITITAPDETTYDCVFARNGYSEQLAYDKRKRREVWHCTLKLLEV